MLGGAILTVSTQGGSLFAGQSDEGLLILVAIFMLFAVRRIYSGLDGIAYSTGRLFRMPALYLLFTLVSVFGFGTLNLYAVSTLTLVPIAALIGYLYATQCSFFYRNGQVYYRRHMYVLTFWIASYIARIVIEFVLPFNMTVEIALSAILSFTTGIVFGEALNIRKKYIEFVGTGAVPAAE